jgi:hypothetical protein
MGLLTQKWEHQPVIGYEPNASYGIRNQHHDCLTTLSTQLTWRIAWRTGKIRLQIWRSHWSQNPGLKSGTSKIEHRSQEANDCKAPNSRMDPKWQISASEGPLQKSGIVENAQFGPSPAPTKPRAKIQAKGGTLPAKKSAGNEGGPQPDQSHCRTGKTPARPHIHALRLPRGGGAPSPPVSPSDVSQSLLGLQGSIASRSGRVEDANCRSVAGCASPKLFSRKPKWHASMSSSPARASATRVERPQVVTSRPLSILLALRSIASRWLQHTLG